MNWTNTVCFYFLILPKLNNFCKNFYNQLPKLIRSVTWSRAPTSAMSRVTSPKSWAARILDPEVRGSPLWYQLIFSPASFLGSTLHSRWSLQSSPTVMSGGRQIVKTGFIPGAGSSSSPAGASFKAAPVSAFWMLSNPACPGQMGKFEVIYLGQL